MNNVQPGQSLACTRYASDETNMTRTAGTSITNHPGQHIRRSIQVACIAVADFSDLVTGIQAFRGLNDRKRWPVRRVNPAIRVYQGRR
jgi:hypothetical protein